MPSFVESSEEAGSAGRTDRSRGKRVGKTHSLIGQIVYVWCVKNGVTRTPHEIASLIIS